VAPGSLAGMRRGTFVTIVVLFALLTAATVYQVLALQSARRHPVPAPSSPTSPPAVTAPASP